jgi:hypothetical protein
MVTSNADERLVAEWLSHTGHSVQAVGHLTDVGSYLKKRRFDVILGDFKDRDAIDAQEANASSTAKYIPVAADPDEAKAAEGMYRQTVTSTSTPKDLLKAIHFALKSDTNRVTGS